jgi:predicted Fe-Mo cluster-binding NifX family protein
MKIAVATGGREATSLIPAYLAEAEFLFIANMDKFEVVQIYEAEEDTRDLVFARRAVDEDCEAIICGQIEKQAFDILSQACVSRYDGAGKSASEALRLLNLYALPLIRDHIGGEGCVAEKSGGECHEHGE